MLDTLIQFNGLAIVGVVGYMSGDATLRVIKGTVGLVEKIWPNVMGLVEPKVEQKVESETAYQVEEEIEAVVENEVYAGIEWIMLGAPLFVTDEELEQQAIDETFEIKFSNYVKKIDWVKFTKFAEFQAVLGEGIEKLKKGYRVRVNGYDEQFSTLKKIGAFLSQLEGNGEIVTVE